MDPAAQYFDFIARIAPRTLEGLEEAAARAAAAERPRDPAMLYATTDAADSALLRKLRERAAASFGDPAQTVMRYPSFIHILVSFASAYLALER